MGCYHPVHLRRNRELVPVGCGKCIGCLLVRSQEWAVRCTHEAQLHAENAFVTLTYAPEHLPPGGTLVRRDPWLFVKRLRKHFAPRRVRFFLCGEYGSERLRPHYHALLFGIDFPDKLFSFKSGSGEDVYTSEVLSSLWSLGFASTGEVTVKSAAYVARYVVKKITESVSSRRELCQVDSETGEVLERLPEFVNMSLKPGIGHGWMQRYMDDVYPSDEVIVRGSRFKVPRYYDKLLEMGDPYQLAQLKLQRVKRAAEKSVDGPKLAAMEQVKVAQVGFLKRNLED